MFGNGSLPTQFHKSNCLVQALKRFPKGDINHGLLNAMDFKKSGGYCGITVIMQRVFIMDLELQYNHSYFIEIVFFNVGLFTEFFLKNETQFI